MIIMLEINIGTAHAEGIPFHVKLHCSNLPRLFMNEEADLQAYQMPNALSPHSNPLCLCTKLHLESNI